MILITLAEILGSEFDLKLGEEGELQVFIFGFSAARDTDICFFGALGLISSFLLVIVSSVCPVEVSSFWCKLGFPGFGFVLSKA